MAMKNAIAPRGKKPRSFSTSARVMRFVDGDELLLVGRDLVEREDRVRRADRDAGAAVDALARVDVDLGGAVERRFIVPRMDAVDRAGLNAELVFDAVV